MPDGDDLPTLPLTFRPLRTRSVLLTVGTMALVAFTAVALAMPAPWAADDRAVMIAVGAALFGLMVLLSRPKVVADRQGLTVVNLVTRRRLEWPQVLGVHLRSGDPWVYLDLADGTSLAAMGIQPGNSRRLARRDALRLRRLAEAYGTGHPAA